MNQKKFNNPKYLLGKDIYFKDKISCSDCEEDDGYEMCENFGNPKNCTQRIVKIKVESVMYSKYGKQTVYTINGEYEFTESQMEQEVSVKHEKKMHKLKTETESFLLICAGKKNFECLKDDREIQLGDCVQLREWNPDTGYIGSESRWLHISYILRDKPEYGLLPGYCIVSWDN